MSRSVPAVLVALLLGGCNEYVVKQQPDPPVAEPPGAADPSDQGEAPDWNDCDEGYLGNYYNLTVDHPDVEPDGAVLPVDDPAVFDWWDEDRLAFERFDPSLDMGNEWWPVDDGLTEDPAYFAARWTAWIRVNATGTHDLVLGATSDVYVLVDGDVVASVQASGAFEPLVVPVELTAGQFPLEVRFAHRMGRSGMRMRFASEDVVVCYPEFE
jgi:hypothetical protein